MNTYKYLKYYFFEQAVKRGYCNIYSGHGIIESSIIRVAKEICIIRGRDEIKRKKVLNGSSEEIN